MTNNRGVESGLAGSSAGGAAGACNAPQSTAGDRGMNQHAARGNTVHGHHNGQHHRHHYTQQHGQYRGAPAHDIPAQVHHTITSHTYSSTSRVVSSPSLPRTLKEHVNAQLHGAAAAAGTPGKMVHAGDMPLGVCACTHTGCKGCER